MQSSTAIKNGSIQKTNFCSPRWDQIDSRVFFSRIFDQCYLFSVFSYGFGIETLAIRIARARRRHDGSRHLERNGGTTDRRDIINGRRRVVCVRSGARHPRRLTQRTPIAGFSHGAVAERARHGLEEAQKAQAREARR